MRISDWSSDVCSSDLQLARVADDVADGEDLRRRGLELLGVHGDEVLLQVQPEAGDRPQLHGEAVERQQAVAGLDPLARLRRLHPHAGELAALAFQAGDLRHHELDLPGFGQRSEEHTSELQSLMRISYAVLCL